MLDHLFRSLVLNWGNFYPPADTQQHLETFLVFLMGWGVAMASSGETKDAAKHPTVTMEAPHTKELSDPKHEVIVLRLRNSGLEDRKLQC